ncbi:MAG: cell division protein FtsQ/DivIB [Clostridiales bacterium]|nr:cell division protein FtsQ/DivIB [Clostridiales bacterium]
MKLRIFIAAGVVLLSLCAFLIRFYLLPDIQPVSGGDELYSCGYVPYADSFLRVDMDGKVLSVTDAADGDLPVLEGIKFTRFTIGDYLRTENNEAFKTTAILIKLFKKYELGDEFISKIDIANLNDIHLYTKNIDVAFGSVKDADEKIRTLKEIIANLRVAEDVKGLLDIRVIGRQYIFSVLT